MDMVQDARPYVHIQNSHKPHNLQETQTSSPRNTTTCAREARSPPDLLHQSSQSKSREVQLAPCSRFTSGADPDRGCVLAPVRPLDVGRRGIDPDLSKRACVQRRGLEQGDG